ncbi:MAG: hypothetical protein ACREP7_07765 [Lysobacter sp.]
MQRHGSLERILVRDCCKANFFAHQSSLARRASLDGRDRTHIDRIVDAILRCIVAARAFVDERTHDVCHSSHVLRHSRYQIDARNETAMSAHRHRSHIAS